MKMRTTQLWGRSVGGWSVTRGRKPCWSGKQSVSWSGGKRRERMRQGCCGLDLDDGCGYDEGGRLLLLRRRREREGQRPWRRRQQRMTGIYKKEEEEEEEARMRWWWRERMVVVRIADVMALYQQQQQQEECGRGPKHEGDEVQSVQAPSVQVLAQARQTQGQVRFHFVQFQGVVGRVPAAAVALAGAVDVGAAVTAPVQSATTACWSALQLPLP